jgi:hypothetical protein
MHLQEVGCGVIDWIDMAKDRNSWRAPVTAVMKPSGPIQCEEFLN